MDNGRGQNDFSQFNKIGFFDLCSFSKWLLGATGADKTSDDNSWAAGPQSNNEMIKGQTAQNGQVQNVKSPRHPPKGVGFGIQQKENPEQIKQSTVEGYMEEGRPKEMTGGMMGKGSRNSSGWVSRDQAPLLKGGAIQDAPPQQVPDYSPPQTAYGGETAAGPKLQAANKAAGRVADPFAPSVAQPLPSPLPRRRSPSATRASTFDPQKDAISAEVQIAKLSGRAHSLEAEVESLKQLPQQLAAASFEVERLRALGERAEREKAQLEARLNAAQVCEVVQGAMGCTAAVLHHPLFLASFLLSKVAIFYAFFTAG